MEGLIGMQLSDQIVQVLDYLADKMGVTINWSQQNVIPYMRQIFEKYIRYEIITSIMLLVIGILFMLSSFLWMKAYKFYVKKYEACKENGKFSDYDVCAGVCICALVVCSLTGLLMIIFQTRDVLCCIYLPELQIYKYIKKL